MKKQLRIAHYPQLPCKPFLVEVETLKEARLVYNILSNYDLFQHKEHIKPDYPNITVVEQKLEGDEKWESWYDDETGIDNINKYWDHHIQSTTKGEVGNILKIIGNTNEHQFEIGELVKVIPWTGDFGDDSDEEEFGVECVSLNPRFSDSWFVRHEDYIFVKNSKTL